MTADAETIVIGAGVVGLAIGRALALAGHEVLVLERNGRIGSETSARNSEVIHAGLYYPPGSLRAKLCVSGKALLYKFCAENGVAHLDCGKLLVATEESELPKLDAIAANAKANGVADLRKLSGEEARSLEPELLCVAAYLSPSTGVIDTAGLMRARRPPDHSRRRGGAQRGRHAPRSSRRRRGRFRRRDRQRRREQHPHRSQRRHRGGFWRDRARPQSELPARVSRARDLSCQGPLLCAVAPRAVSSSRHLVYPMPTGAWLGVHLTFDVAHRARFGPDIAWVDNVSYQLGPSKKAIS